MSATWLREPNQVRSLNLVREFRSGPTSVHRILRPLPDSRVSNCSAGGRASALRYAGGCGGDEPRRSGLRMLDAGHGVRLVLVERLLLEQRRGECVESLAIGTEEVGHI